MDGHVGGTIAAAKGEATDDDLTLQPSLSLTWPAAPGSAVRGTCLCTGRLADGPRRSAGSSGDAVHRRRGDHRRRRADQGGHPVLRPGRCLGRGPADARQRRLATERPAGFRPDLGCRRHRYRGPQLLHAVRRDPQPAAGAAVRARLARQDEGSNHRPERSGGTLLRRVAGTIPVHRSGHGRLVGADGESLLVCR